MAIYLKLDPIKGSVTDSKFKEQIELSSFQWGAGIGVGAPEGGNRTTSKASISEITATKALDASTQGLFKQLLLGTPVAKGTISFVAAVKGESIAYSTIDLEQIIVSGFSQSSGGDFPTESISLNFTKFVYSYSGRDDKQASSPVRLTYDLVLSKLA